MSLKLKCTLEGHHDKVRDIWDENKRDKRNYLERMNIDDARVWFRYRSKMTIRVKGNRTSAFRDNMDCRHCDTKEEETQEHLEVCKGTEDLRQDIDMNLNIEHDKMVFWKKLTRRLSKIIKIVGRTTGVKSCCF